VRKVDLASLLGLVLCGVVILVGILTSIPTPADAIMYVNIPSIFITFGGTIFCTLMSVSLADFIRGFQSFTLIFKGGKTDTGGIITKIIQLSNVARKEGLLALEEAAGELDDAFMKKGILLIVDGTDPDLVRAILETELYSIEGRHKGVNTFWDTMTSMGPAWGMVGTLIGLVAMLQNMSDPTSIGPAMATALLTTLYGSVLANWISTPVSNKLKANNGVEMKTKEIMIEGLLSIQAGENPRVIEEKLKSFMAPKERAQASTDTAEGGE
jgi:chemotaxis protein MotA